MSMDLDKVKILGHIALAWGILGIPFTYLAIIAAAMLTSEFYSWVGNSGNPIPMPAWIITFLPAVISFSLGIMVTVRGIKLRLKWSIAEGVFAILMVPVLVIFAWLSLAMMSIG